MRIQIILLAVILLSSLSFAAGSWMTTAAIAIVAAVVFIAILYAVGMGFGIQELQITAKDEVYQIAFLIVMLSVFAGLTVTVGDTLQSDAKAKISTDITMLQAYFTKLTELEKVSIEGSKTLSCNIMMITVTMSGCGGYSALSPAVTTTETVVSIGIVELNTLKTLLSISDVALTIIMPIGIILRTFKITRAAGGLLLAIGAALYLILPLSIVFIDPTADAFAEKNSDYNYLDEFNSKTGFLSPSFSIGEPQSKFAGCSPGDTPNSLGSMTGLSSNDDAALGLLNDMAAHIKKPLFLVLVKGTLFSIIYLFIFSTSIKYLSMAAGAEIDASALGRLM
ncbi:MAG: hypothetical protein V1492_01960 [Candidatus Micrarchaeota archaeon]